MQERLELVFHTFLKFRTVAKVMRVLNERGLDLPRRDRLGDLRWARATVSAVASMLKILLTRGTVVADSYSAVRTPHQLPQ